MRSCAVGSSLKRLYNDPVEKGHADARTDFVLAAGDVHTRLRSRHAHEVGRSPEQDSYCGRQRSRLRDERGIIGRFPVGWLARTGRRQ
jgi:hypothetical protein